MRWVDFVPGNYLWLLFEFASPYYLLICPPGALPKTASFVHEGEPPADRPVELLCEDHIGTYVGPSYVGGAAGTGRMWKLGERIDAMVMGWRAMMGEA
jgi:hypothetical protein